MGHFVLICCLVSGHCGIMNTVVAVDKN